MGWGRTEYNGKTSDLLKKVEIPIVDLETCKRNYNSYSMTDGVEREVFDSNICTGGESFESEFFGDSCQGDSGGPVTFFDRNKIGTVVGIISWGEKCAMQGLPGVNIRVEKYRVLEKKL